jgi:hypothetical protein
MSATHLKQFKQFGLGSAFFVFILLAAGMAKALVGPTVVVASEGQSSQTAPATAAANR